MQQPLGFENENTYLVCKFNKVLYCIKMTLRVVYEKLHRALFQYGFSSSKCNHSLFIYKHQDNTLYALVYVDVVLIT